MSSWVIPLVRCPKPLKMRSQCCKWKNTAMPPAAMSTTEQMSAGICALAPTPRSEYAACVPNRPADHASSVVKRIRGHCSSMIYSSPCHVRFRRM